MLNLPSLADQPLHKEEGSGTAPLFELFCWNAINIHELTFSYARFTLCNDTLTAAHGLHTACSALVCQVSTVVVCACISAAVILRPQDFHIHVPQDFWGTEQLE